MKPFILIVLLQGSAVACDNGWNHDPETGVCMESTGGSDKPYVPSDEKPPRNPIPAWQRGDVHAAGAPDQFSKDAAWDKSIKDADHAGKKAAHVPQ